MDRRQALRSIAIGSSAAVAGSAIISSPAFAYDSPTPLTGGSIAIGSAGGNSNNRFDVDQTSLGSASCPASATISGTMAAVALLRWNIATTVIAPPTSVVQIRVNGGGGIQDTTSIGSPGVSTALAGFRLRKRGAGGSGNQNWVTGDQFVIGQVVRFTCTYSDSTTRTIDRTTTFTLTKGSGGAGANDWIVT